MRQNDEAYNKSEQNIADGIKLTAKLRDHLVSSSNIAVEDIGDSAQQVHEIKTKLKWDEKEERKRQEYPCR